jgi:hypothetical protein
MSPKQWWFASLGSLGIAGVMLYFSGSSNLLHIFAMAFVFLSLWLLKQRKIAAQSKQAQAIRDSLNGGR